jgi:hypothetical protein
MMMSIDHTNNDMEYYEQEYATYVIYKNYAIQGNK